MPKSPPKKPPSKRPAPTTPTPRREPPPLPPGVEAVLTQSQVAFALGCSTRQVRKLIAANQYPQPDTEVGESPRWSVAMHNEWVAAQKRKDNPRAGSLPPQGSN